MLSQMNDTSPQRYGDRRGPGTRADSARHGGRLDGMVGARQAEGQTRPATGAAARTADGTPNLNGVRQALTTHRGTSRITTRRRALPPGQGVVEGGAIPSLPAAAARLFEYAR
jgi:hypothetical protein